jgi:hypothetical protein
MAGQIRTRNRAGAAVGLALAAAVAAAGCSRSQPVGEVEGAVRVNGRPLANVVVEFLPDPEKGTTGPRSTGVTDEQGRYQLRCDDQRAGAVTGWHRIVLEDLNMGRPAQGQPVKTVSRVAPRYSKAATTPLLKEVKAGKQTIDLELTGP